MKRKYEYKFIRLGEGVLGISRKANAYKEVIEREAEEGWRLVQVFSPSLSFYGKATFFEVILERELTS